jgi:hypothetical protein
MITGVPVAVPPGSVPGVVVVIAGLPVVVVIGMVVLGIPDVVVVGTPVVGVAQLPVAQFDVLGLEQQVELQPIEPKTTRLATPAASRSFFISQSLVNCPAAAKSPGFRTLVVRSTRSRGVCGVYRLFA